ncbi:MAG: TRAP transporter substrate-binding protein [Gammaproteobacteria bacterium]|nr:TRAP transporter substrate-binding protein [Gammaproteobacteria bacterium]
MKKLFLALAACAFTSSVFAETQWRFAASYGDETLHTKTIRYFAEQVKEGTAGEINIQVFSNQSLVKQNSILQATKNGKVELGEVLLSGYDNIHALWGIDSLPFISNSYDKAKKLWEISKKPISEDLDGMNLVLLYTVPWPGQNIYSKNAINSVEDFSGKNFRTYNDTTKKIASLLGANAKNVAYSDIVEKFSSGDLDIMMTSSSSGVGLKSWNYIKHYTKIDASFPKNMVFMNKAIFEGLDEATRKAIMESAKKAEKYGWDMSKSEHESSEALMSEKGINISESTKSLQQLLFRIGQKLDSQWRAKADAVSLKVMKEFRGY